MLLTRKVGPEHFGSSRLIGLAAGRCASFALDASGRGAPARPVAILGAGSMEKPLAFVLDYYAPS